MTEFVYFNRPIDKLTKTGKRIGYAPPEILDKDGSPLKNTLIGNGSDVTIKLEVYSHGTPGGGKAKAARLLSVRVDNLVVFVKDESFSPDQQRAVKGLEDQPEQLF